MNEPPTCQLLRQPNLLASPTVPSQEIPSVVADTIENAFPRKDDRSRLRSTPKIAIGVGSRGIANIDLIVKAVGDTFRGRGYQPFIVPAMGSHGGATQEGQIATLQKLGISEETVGLPIIGDMTTVQITNVDSLNIGIGVTSWQDDTLIFPIGRIKPHTGVVSPTTQSGLRKMLLIGFGKQSYAAAYHSVAGTAGLGPVIERGSEALVASGRVLGGLAIVEGPNHGTYLLEAIRAADFSTREPKLLALANRLMPTFPSALPSIDILHLWQVGKPISGTSADPNVTSKRLDGTSRVPGKGTTPIGVVCASNAHPDTAGNLVGVHLLDAVTDKLAQEIGPATFENARASGSVKGAQPKLGLPDDESMIRWAFSNFEAGASFVSIRDTLHLGEMIVDSSTARSLRTSDEVEFVGKPFELRFEGGNLVNLWNEQPEQ